MTKLLIHIGLHKTGTTYLQESLFPRIDNCAVVRGFHSHRDLLKALNQDFTILSDESISGYFWKGAYEQEFYKNLNKLKNIYNDPMILIGVRSHKSWISYLYKQYLHEGGTKPMNFLFNKENTGQLKKEEIYIVLKLKYLKASFDKVFVYNQQQLFLNEEEFLKALAEFCNEPSFQLTEEKNISANVGIKTNLQFKALIFLNRINLLFEKVHPFFSLYHPILKKLGLTPRNLCQGLLRYFPSQKFKMEDELENYINIEFKQDWVEVENELSF